VQGSAALTALTSSAKSQLCLVKMAVEQDRQHANINMYSSWLNPYFFQRITVPAVNICQLNNIGADHPTAHRRLPATE
jgi:hypothetical protein